MEEKSLDTFRIWGNNFNGLSLDASGGDFMELCKEAATMQADIVTGSKHNLDARNYYVQKICYETCMKNRNVGHLVAQKLKQRRCTNQAAPCYWPVVIVLLESLKAATTQWADGVMSIWQQEATAWSPSSPHTNHATYGAAPKASLRFMHNIPVFSEKISAGSQTKLAKIFSQRPPSLP
jgi:hypothetical protein